jgi:hypothetical protein
MKCEINKVSQKRCNRKAITCRDTGKTTIYLCGKCDKLLGEKIGPKGLTANLVRDLVD